MPHRQSFCRFANLNPVAREDMQKRYEDLIASYGMEPSRNNRGEAHENGSIESRHGHLRSRIEQALLLRGSRDFDTVDDLRDFVAEIVARHNAQRQEEVKLERAELLPLPDRRSCDYDTGTCSRHVQQRFCLSQGVLHGSFASDRF